MIEYRDTSGATLANWENAVEKAIQVAAIKVQREAVRLVTRHVGVAKTDYGKALGFRSSPGEPPYVETGTLARSIDQETLRKGDDFIGRVGTNLKYGYWLEVGTRDMDPRPWLRPALDNKRREIFADIKEAAGR